ncbi:MAG: 30S ribosomal protein S17 [Gammaproteobacteria bacterium]|nr:30S ribosomal protein S17 [Gammaproteobacteria bacterium]
MSDAPVSLTRRMSGVVVSDSADKTIAVRIDRRVRHPLYKKIIGRRSKLQAHDENNEAKMGDRVTIEECRPISKTKSWKLSSIDEKA